MKWQPLETAPYGKELIFGWFEKNELKHIRLMQLVSRGALYKWRGGVEFTMNTKPTHWIDPYALALENNYDND